MQYGIRIDGIINAILEVEHDYPSERQSVIKLGVEADKVAAEAMIQAVMGNAHGEEIELWASRIQGVS